MSSQALVGTEAVRRFAVGHGVEPVEVWAAALDVLFYLLDYPGVELEGKHDFARIMANRIRRDSVGAAANDGWGVTAPQTGVLDTQALLHAPPAVGVDELGRHCGWLEGLVARLIEAPHAQIAQFDVLEEGELAAQLVRSWGPRGNYPHDARIETLCFARAAAQPDAVAIVDGDVLLTYADLCERADVLAAELTRLGVGPGVAVALQMPRCAGMVVSALGVLRAGALYVPIDPEYPQERIRYLLDDCGARYRVLLEGEHVADGTTLVVARSGLLVNATRSPGCAPGTPVASRSAAAQVIPASQPAYLMYTSGSTGQPKGVPVPHRGVVRLAYGLDDLALDASSVMLFAGAVGFDSTVLEMWCPLIHGGRLCIAERDDLLDSARLRELLVRCGVNTLFMTPALFALHADRDPAMFATVRQVALGGDRFPARHARLVADACKDIVFINGYGPTENAVFSTTCRVVPAEDDVVPIGRPIGHSSAYVLNAHRRVLPDGVIGELYVGGDGLGLGYHGRPDLTEAAFVPHPYETGLRLYRTGDFARIGKDGTLHFHGRRDHQVKIRGHRIELGEIESLLNRYPAVRAAVVLTRTDAVGEPLLVAWLQVEQPVDVVALREWLRAKLPAPLIPARFECVDAFPVTTNGKVDRAALAARDLVTASALATTLPQDHGDAVRLLVAQTLALPDVAMDMSFAGQGGSSLAAARLARRIETELGRRCSASTILAAASIAALVQTVSVAPPPRATLASATATADRMASPQQRRLYIEQIKAPASRAYNLPFVVEFDRVPDIERLRAAFAQLVVRHPLLAASFDLESDVLMQRIGTDLTVEIPTLQEPDGGLAQLVKPFDLGVAPLWRAALIEGKSARMFFDIHHILCDGHALQMFFDEWDRLYRGEALAPLDLSYADLTEWQQQSLGGQQQAQHRAFWLNELQPLPCALTLPTDRLRSTARSDRGAHVMFEISEARTVALGDLARRCDATLFQALIAVYAIWLARATSSRDMVIGVPFNGRQLPGSDRVFGICVNTVCLRLRLDEASTIQDVIRLAAQQALTAADHQDYAFDELVRELVPSPDYRRHPIFDTMFAFQDAGLTGMSALGGTVRWVPSATQAALFDLNLQIEPSLLGLSATWGYADDIFDHASVEAFAADFLVVLDMVVSMPAKAIAKCLEDCDTPPASLPEIDFSF